MHTQTRPPKTGPEDLVARPIFRKILIPLDGSPLAEKVLPYARILAEGFEAHVELLNVYDSALEGLADPTHGHYSHQIDASLRSQALDYLLHVTPSICYSGVRVSCTAEAGDPTAWIVSEAKKEPGTLIAMSTHGRSGATRLMLGSVTDKVLHSSNTPVLVLRPRNENPYVSEINLRNVIVPLDGSSLAEQVLPHVVFLAKALDLTVTLLRVTPHRRDGPLVDYLENVTAKLRGEGVPSVERRTIGNHPAETIVTVARETPHSMVAMTTHCRSGVPRSVLGSVTDHVVRHCGEPVLIVQAAKNAGSGGWIPQLKEEPR